MKYHITTSILIATAGALGYFSHGLFGNLEMIEPDYSIRNGSGYQFIDPLLECESNGERQKYIPFEGELLTALEENMKKKYPNIHLSVYFRNLRNGPWFGIAMNEKFVPASLMKTAIMITYLKLSESAPGILDTQLTLAEKSGLTQVFSPGASLEVGKNYTIRELIEHMIIYSDNDATGLLLKELPVEERNKVLKDFGLPIVDDGAQKYELTVRQYASMFRLLYNASYLNRTNSEYALSVLARSQFKNGMVAQLPFDTKVAHKFGEREYVDENGVLVHQLHDCGIVYNANYPYLACLMSKGPSADWNTLSSVLQESSKIIFDTIRQRYGYSGE